MIWLIFGVGYLAACVREADIAVEHGRKYLYTPDLSAAYYWFAVFCLALFAASWMA